MNKEEFITILRKLAEPYREAYNEARLDDPEREINGKLHDLLIAIAMELEGDE